MSLIKISGLKKNFKETEEARVSLNEKWYVCSPSGTSTKKEASLPGTTSFHS